MRVVAQGAATAKVGTLGDAKRTGDALAQQSLIWERVDAKHWTGREATADERRCMVDAHELNLN